MKRLIGVLVGATALTCVAVAQNQTPAATKPAATPAPAAKPATAPAAKPADKAPAGAAGDMPFTPEQMQKMMEAGTPGEFHKKLEVFNGKWNYTMKSWMDPKLPPQESTGTAEYKTSMDGRIQQQTINGTMDMGTGPMPFTGFGLSGYDNTSKKYWNIWIDSMSTNYMSSTGTVDATGKVFTFTGSYECPVFGHCSAAYTLKVADPNKFVMEFNSTSSAGPPCKMELTYTRAK